MSHKGKKGWVDFSYSFEVNCYIKLERTGKFSYYDITLVRILLIFIYLYNPNNTASHPIHITLSTLTF